jgi:hypothetical protein
LLTWIGARDSEVSTIERFETSIWNLFVFICFTFACRTKLHNSATWAYQRYPPSLWQHLSPIFKFIY